MSRFGRPRPLSPEDDTRSFSSGRTELDMWLGARALKAEVARTARTYVIVEDATELIAGFYCLSSFSISRELAGGASLARNTPDPVPVVLLGRLAVDSRYQGLGLGKALLKDALLKAIAATQLIGARALVVHALDADAAGFYERFGFTPLPANPLHLYLPLTRLSELPRAQV